MAIATGIFRCTFTVAGESGSAQSRSKVVLVDDDGDWLIAHEHHSPLSENDLTGNRTGSTRRRLTTTGRVT